MEVEDVELEDAELEDAELEDVELVVALGVVVRVVVRLLDGGV